MEAGPCPLCLPWGMLCDPLRKGRDRSAAEPRLTAAPQQVPSAQAHLDMGAHTHLSYNRQLLLVGCLELSSLLRGPPDKCVFAEARKPG